MKNSISDENPITGKKIHTRKASKERAEKYKKKIKTGPGYFKY